MKILQILILFIFLGCSQKTFVYINTTQKPLKSIQKPIGINEVDLPLYMSDLEVMKLKNSKLVHTGIYISKDIKNVFVTMLSNILNDPYVYSYPFGMNIKPKEIINIKIDDFYLKDDKIILNGRFFIKNSNLLFKKVSLSEKCGENYKCINEILEKFTKIIAKDIK